MRRLFLVIFLLLSGCTDAELSQWGALGEPGHITCYSGGQVIYEGQSTGKIATEGQTDGWFLTDASTGRLVRVSGDCVVKN